MIKTDVCGEVQLSQGSSVLDIDCARMEIAKMMMEGGVEGENYRGRCRLQDITKLTKNVKCGNY